MGGGRISDAITGATAGSAVRLVTADRRALATYALPGADVQLWSHDLAAEIATSHMPG